MFGWNRTLAAGLALVGILCACGGEDPLPTGPIDDEPATGDQAQSTLIRLYDNLPAPSQITVEAGTLVEWKNMGANDHTVTNYSQGYEEWVDHLVEPGEAFVHVFQEPGDYGFICIIHQEVGYVTVVAADVELMP
jgi:plastocyanin